MQWIRTGTKCFFLKNSRLYVKSESTFTSNAISLQYLRFYFYHLKTRIDLIGGDSSQQNDRSGSSAGEGSQAVKEAGLRVIAGQ